MLPQWSYLERADCLNGNFNNFLCIGLSRNRKTHQQSRQKGPPSYPIAVIHRLVSLYSQSRTLWSTRISCWHLRCETAIVSDHDHSGPSLLIEPKQEFVNCRTGSLIQVTGHLIRQDKWWVQNQRTSQSDALLFPSESSPGLCPNRCAKPTASMAFSASSRFPSAPCGQ